jgi:hypothetical protein
MNSNIQRAPSPEDIDEYSTDVYVSEQLDRLEGLVRERGGDEDMLVALGVLREDNEFRTCPVLE